MSGRLLSPVRRVWAWTTALWERVAKRWHELLDFVNKPGDGWAIAVRWAIAVFLFLVALFLLVGLNYLLRGGALWGDLAFAVIVTTGVFWALRRLAHLFLVEGDIKALPRAFATTIFVLIGIPVAWVTRPWGLALLLLPIGVWAVAQSVYGLQDWKKRKAAELEKGGEAAGESESPPKRFPVFWHAEVAGVALLAIVLFVAPSVGSADRVAQAVPLEQVEGGEQDLAVATAFRPLLFFDSGERRFPLDVQDAIADDRVQICRKAVGDDNCSVVENAELIDASQDYLVLDEAPGTPRGGNETSAIYYHVTRPDDGAEVYVDYWWFYSRNPSPVADKVFCGPGLRWPPYTCQEHAGDWEGLTVVLAPCSDGDAGCETVGDEGLTPEAVRYAQHAHVFSYDWETLSDLWGALDIPRAAAIQETWQEVVIPAIREAGVQPVAFVARNSHASYPAPCFGGCRQTTGELPEAPHNGAVPWTGNEECDECVKRLPLTAEGEPALWNAFPGRWGEQHCILAGAYCDLSGAPKGPSFQERYRDPAGEVEEICLSGTRLEPC